MWAWWDELSEKGWPQWSIAVVLGTYTVGVFTPGLKGILLWAIAWGLKIWMSSNNGQNLRKRASLLVSNMMTQVQQQAFRRECEATR